MSKFIFLDTNNWIYLSNGFNILSNKHDELHLKIFDIIQKRTDERSITFLVNSIILDEWERDRDKAENQIKEIENKFKSYSNNLKSIKAFLQTDPDELRKIEELLKEAYNEKLKRHKDHVKNVEGFLKNKTTKIDVSDKNKIEASNLASEKKAPFIGDKKNSMADALILLSSIEHIFTHEKIINPFKEDDYKFPESYFVSSNKGDFSSDEDKEKIHPHLKSFLNRTGTKFYFTLGKLVNSLEEKFLTEEEENILEHIDERLHCEVCNYEYYPTVNFSEYLEVIDPNHLAPDPNQLSLPLPLSLANHNTDQVEYKPSQVQIRTADCSYCGAEYLECDCGALNVVDQYNTNFECIGECGKVYVVHADIDKKGMVHCLEYEIVESHVCEKCGETVDSISEDRLCGECAEYERISHEN